MVVRRWLRHSNPLLSFAWTPPAGWGARHKSEARAVIPHQNTNVLNDLKVFKDLKIIRGFKIVGRQSKSRNSHKKYSRGRL